MTPFHPMLLAKRSVPPLGAGWIYECKWDGFRAIVEVTARRVRVWSRNGNDLTQRFPELQHVIQEVSAPCVLDCELVVLDDNGHPRFEWITSRKRPATLVAFDILRAQARALVEQPLSQRRRLLNTIVPADAQTVVRSRVFSDGLGLLTQCERLKLEGIVAKRLDSKYQPAVRSDDWVKVHTAHGRAVIASRMRRGRRQ